MKVAVIGYGNVGMAVFSAMLQMREIQELVLVGRNQDKINGELSDYLDSLAVSDQKIKIGGGDYRNLKDADIIVYAAGYSVKTTAQSRLDLIRDNIAVAKSVCGEINKYNKDGIIIVISNPVDPLTNAIREFTGRPREKVIGTGTMLETARLKRIVSELFDVRPADVQAYALGEHGDSSFIVWSLVRILGMTLDEFLSLEIDALLNINKEELIRVVHEAGFRIVENKGNTCYGVAAIASKIASAIIFDTNEIMSVSETLEGEYGISGVAVSVPCLINRSGAHVIDHVPLEASELDSLRASAEIVRRASN